MAAHQTRFSGEVTAEDNRLLAVDAIERLEREAVETKPAPAPSIAEPDPEAAITEPEATTERREVDGKAYLLKKEPDSPILRKANAHEAWFLAHALPRIELLLEKKDTGPLGQPSWHQRTLAVLALKKQASDFRVGGFHDEARELEGRFVAEMAILLEDSCRLFGDWKADAPTKVMVG